MVEKGDHLGEEGRGLPCTEKPLALTSCHVFSGSAETKHIVTSGTDVTHQGKDCPAHWASLPLVIPVPSLAGPADLKETH